MTYQQSVEMFANPPGMCAVTQANNLVMSAGKVIEFVGTRAMKGNLHNQITINASGSITLPSGYYYYLEGTTQGYYASVTDPSDTAAALYQWHEGTTAVGSRGQIKRQYQGSDAILTTADEKAIHFVDATAGAVEEFLKIMTFTKFTHINYSSDQYVYAGFGRAVVVQLEP